MIPRFTLAAAFAASLFTGSVHAAGTAKVTLGSTSYSIDSVTCSGNADSFTVQARATTGAQLIEFGAFKGEVNSVGFRVGDTMAQVADNTGTFDGNMLTFTGEAQVYTSDAINRQKLSIEATCG